MILQQYIQEVLFRQRVCVIPQLGTFTLQHFPAQYNVNSQTLTPPWDQVLFSQTYKDDGSCVEWIALKENLVPSVAQRKLEKYLEEMKAELRTGKPMELPGIGTLQGDFAGNIHFFAEKLPVTQESLDLYPIREEEEPAPAAPEPIAPIEPVMTDEVENVLEAIEEESSFKWWWAVAAVAVVGAAAGAWWYISQQNHHANTITDVPMDTVIQDTPAVQTSPVDSMAVDSNAAAMPVLDTSKYVAVYYTTKDSTDAGKKLQRQLSWGRKVIMYLKDDTYRLAVEVDNTDTTTAIQQVRKDFGNQAFLEKH